MSYMRFYTLLAIVFCLCCRLTAQEKEHNINHPVYELSVLTEKERFQLQTLPKLKLPTSYKNKSLPYSVDNTQNIYYTGLFLQAGYSCGQAAAVSMGFAYEINRLRGLDGSLVENKYPTHFSWNWINGGNGWYGGSYFHSFELLRSVGTPNMETYGGSHDFGGPRRWMTGYDAYYEAMHNRIYKAYGIDCSTEEGILTLKHYLNDHLDGSDTGGFGFFYSQHQYPSNVLPVGTENAGDLVITTWGMSPNHAMTITGYNDSIKWDYNGDGQYTNHLDINGDGIVDVRDWEIGAFRMNNTYGGAPYEAWMMYKSLAEPSDNGGIWNNVVNVVYPLKDYSPVLTYRVNMYYSRRAMIKIMAGMSTDLEADEPEHIINFPIFDYQGDNLGMQGENDEDSRHIEFGLDVSPFVNLLEPGQEAKFFLIISENDPESWGHGYITEFAVRDYSGIEPVELIANSENVSINNNTTTYLGVSLQPGFSKPEISTEELPQAGMYLPYSYQLQAENGRPPYRWEFDTDYEISEISLYEEGGFNNTTQGIKSLPFEFDFFGEKYNSVYLSNRGFIDFTGSSHFLPYNDNDSYISFINHKCIAAFHSLGTHNIAVRTTPGSITFRWSSSYLTAYVELHSNNSISIYYSNLNPAHNVKWSGGISSGDIDKFEMIPFSGSLTEISNKGFVFEPKYAPEDFKISQDGLLTGIPQQAFVNYELAFKVIDVGGVSNTKVIPISTNGLVLNYEVVTPNNDSIEWGEQVYLNIELSNITEVELTNLELSLIIENENIVLLDSYHFVGNILPMESLDLDSAFCFLLNYEFVNNQELPFKIIAESDQETWEINIVENIYTAEIYYLSYFIDDGDNNALDAGEIADVIFSFENLGGSYINDLFVNISTDDEWLNIINDEFIIPHFASQQNANAAFVFSAHESTPQGHLATVQIDIEAPNGYQKQFSAFIAIGQIVEDWETGDFSSYNWSHGGDNAWFVTNSDAYEGTYSVRSGNIGHNQESVLEFQVEVLSGGLISFYRKVSCEEGPFINYDYLAFFIDNQEKGRWDGEQDWDQFSYFVEPGIRTFKWIYSKDVTVSAHQDAAWIDFIEFPAIYDPEQSIFISEESIHKTLPSDVIHEDTLIIANTGGGIISYELEILNSFLFEDKNNKSRSVAGSYIECFSDYFYMGDSVNWNFRVYNASPDSEWLREVRMHFPEGFELVSVSDIIDQSNDTLFLISGEPGDGGSFTWIGETDQGWGVIVGNESGFFNVQGVVSDSFDGDLQINYEIIGDIYGSAPHELDSFLTIMNYGPPILWLSADTQGENIGVAQESQIALSFNTEGMAPGIYNRIIRIVTNISEHIIPVELIVDNTMKTNSDRVGGIALFPNPTSDFVHIESPDYINNIKLIGVSGNVVFNKDIRDLRSLSLNLSFLTPGIYMISVTTESGVYNEKLIVK